MSEKWRDYRAKSLRHKLNKETAEAMAALGRAIELATEQDPAELPGLYNSKAGMHLKCNELDAAETAARLTLDSVNDADGIDPERLATYHLMMARVHELKGRLSDALGHMEKAVGLFEGKYNSDYHYSKMLRRQMDELRGAS